MDYNDLLNNFEARTKKADMAIGALLSNSSLLKKAVVVNVLTSQQPQGPQKPGQPPQQVMGSQFMGGGMPVPSPLALAGVFPVGPGPKPIIRPYSSMPPSMQQGLFGGPLVGYRPSRRLGLGRPRYPRRRLFLM